MHDIHMIVKIVSEAKIELKPKYEISQYDFQSNNIRIKGISADSI